MITVCALNKSYPLQTLFENVSFTLNASECVGLIGPNGCGKTTLLRILAGLEPATSGKVILNPATRIGYLPQGFEPDPALSLADLIGQAASSPAALETELAETAAALAQRPDDPALASSYDDLLRRIQNAQEGRAAHILAGLGLDAIDPTLPAGLLSGGQKTRLALALVLLKDPHLLLLDEPTNHLDIEMLEWLEDWLGHSPCAVLLVSHDRTFLDHCTTRILEMEPLHAAGGICRVREFTGNYSQYLAQRQAEIDRQWATYHDQQAEIQRMKEDITRVKAQAQQTERQTRSVRLGGSEMGNKGVKDHLRAIAGKVAKKAKSREKKLERYLDSQERVERPQSESHIQMNFSATPHLGSRVISAENLDAGYDPGAPLLHHINLEVSAGRRIAITGPNGSGKTTLLRTLSGQIPPLGGRLHRGPTVRIGVMSQDQSSLDPGRSALDHILPYQTNPTRARAFLASLLFQGDEPLKPASQLSYGQRARLMLALLVAQECNCLLLDEPVNHLDIPSRAMFEQALAGFSGAVLAVVHDRYFIERFAQEIWWVEKGSLNRQILL